MQQRPARLEWKVSRSQGTPLNAFERQVVPLGRVVRINWPGGGIVWHRPVAVEVQQAGHTTHLAIPDLTRLISILISLSGVLFVLLVPLWKQGIAGRQRRGRS